MYIQLLILIFTLTWHTSSYAEQVYFGNKGVRYEYCYSVLKLVIDLSQEKFGPAELSFHPNEQFINVTSGRSLELVAAGDLDVNCIGYNSDRKNRFQWIEPGIHMGLLGYRILLILDGQQSAFHSVTDLQSLNSQFKGGFISSWSDMQVLQHNKLNTITTHKYTSLISMLKAGRFDYISRGINEIWTEIERFNNAEGSRANFTAEKNLALFYPADHFIVTAKKNLRLAERLRYGMHLAMQDDSLRRLFLETMGPVLNQADLKNRKIIYLENPQPMLNIKTDWWLEPNQRKGPHHAIR